MPRKPKFKLNEIEINTDEIGSNIAKIRKSKGFTQTELAERIGITQALLSHYEVGRLQLPAKMLVHFAITLNVSSDKILGLSSALDNYDPISPTLLKKIRAIENLPQHERKALMKTIDNFLKANN